MQGGEDVEKKLKKYIPDYSKEKKYLTTKNIYRFLKPFQSKAIRNAKKLEKERTDNISRCFPRCDMHHLINALIYFNNPRLQHIIINGRKLNPENEFTLNLPLGEPLHKESIRCKKFSNDTDVAIKIIEQSSIELFCTAPDKKQLSFIQLQSTGNNA